MQEDKTMKYFTVARQQTAMHPLMQPWLKTMSDKPAPSHLRRQGSLLTLVLGLSLSVVPAILSGKNLHAQTQAPQAANPAQHQKAEVDPVETPRAAPKVIAVGPPASQAPIGDANPPSNQASVSWDNSGLEIKASNSSLNQILHQVAVDMVPNWKDLPRISASLAATVLARQATCSGSSSTALATTLF